MQRYYIVNRLWCVHGTRQVIGIHIVRILVQLEDIVSIIHTFNE